MRKSVTVKVWQFFPSKLSRITRCPWQKWGVSYFSTTQRKRFCWSHLHQIKREQLSRKGLIFQALKVTNAVNRDDGKVSAGAINIDQYRVMLKCASSKNGTILALSYMHESDDIRVMKSSFSLLLLKHPPLSKLPHYFIGNSQLSNTVCTELSRV